MMRRIQLILDAVWNGRDSRRQELRIFAGGGLGDVLLLTPALRALRAEHPTVRIIVLCLSRGAEQILRHNPHIDHLKTFGIKSSPIEVMRYRFARLASGCPYPKGSYRYMNFNSLMPTLFDMGHATRIIGQMLGVPVNDRKLEVFLTSQEEANASRLLGRFECPVALQTGARYSANKQWPVAKWAELVRRNRQWSFILLGSERDEMVPGALDLRGRTSLRESMAIVQKSRCAVSVESFLGHVANAVSTPGVVLFGPSTERVAGHATNMAVRGDVPHCSPCLDFLQSAACPYGARCMSSISVSSVERAIRSQIERSGRERLW